VFSFCQARIRLNACEVTFFQCGGKACSNEIEIYVCHTGNKGYIIKKSLAFEAAFPESAAVCAENTPGPWQAAGMFTNSRSMTIDGLTPGTTYMFQVRAIGGSTRYSDWSNSVSRMCV
jgi:hypothetical protein